MVGGGILDLIVYCGEAKDRSGAIQFLKDKGFIAKVDKETKTTPVLRSHIYRFENGEPNRKTTKYIDGSWRQFGWFDGEWRPTVQELQNIPYQLEALHTDKSDRLIFIFEGEKDVDRAIQNGLLATCNAGGAGNWKPELNSYLIDRSVCIVPDNDTAGLNHADKVFKSLSGDKIEAFIMTSHLSELSEKGDFSNWMEVNANNVDQFLKLVELDKANQPSVDELYLQQYGIKNANALLEMQFQPLKFHCDGIIPAVGLTLLAALPKTGKSWLALNFSKSMDEEGVPVHYLAAEDNERRLKSVYSRSFHWGYAFNLSCGNVVRASTAEGFRCFGSY